jgi:DNA mismatch repair protein MutS
MPPELLKMAEEKLAALELSTQMKGSKKSSMPSPNSSKTPQMQLSIFEAQNPQSMEWKAFLETIDIERLTPLEALVKLQEIKKKLG